MFHNKPNVLHSTHHEILTRNSKKNSFSCQATHTILAKESSFHQSTHRGGETVAKVEQ